MRPPVPSKPFVAASSTDPSLLTAQANQHLSASPAGRVSAHVGAAPAPAATHAPMRISLTGRHLKDVRRRVRALVAAPVVQIAVDVAAAEGAMVAELANRPGEGERVRHVAAE